VGLIIVAHGAGQRRSVGQWAPLARRVAPDFSSSRCVGLRVFRRARDSLEMMMKEAEEKNGFSSPAARSGEEESGTMSLKTTPFCSSFFFFKSETASFHLKKRRQNASISKSALNYLLFISIASLSISSPPSYLAAFSTLVLGL
jgi:hypothetical protein